MTNTKRYEKYIKEHCKNCKNKKSDLCDIRISVINSIIQTKCVYYEKDKISQKNKILNVTASKNKPIMKRLV